MLTGIATPTGLFQVTNGAVILTGRLSDTTGNSIQIAPVASQTGVMYVNGGTLNAGGDLRIGFAEGSSGFLRINNGVVTSGAQTLVGALNTTGAQRFGGLSLNGGTLTSATYVVVGFNNNIATYRQTDGFASLTGNALLTIAAGGNGSIGNMDIMGGRFDVLTGESGSGRSVIIGETGSAVLTVSGTGMLIAANNNRPIVVGQANNTAGTLFGVLNLNGGHHRGQHPQGRRHRRRPRRLRLQRRRAPRQQRHRNAHQRLHFRRGKRRRRVGPQRRGHH